MLIILKNHILQAAEAFGWNRSYPGSLGNPDGDWISHRRNYRRLRSHRSRTLPTIWEDMVASLTNVVKEKWLKKKRGSAQQRCKLLWCYIGYNRLGWWYGQVLFALANVRPALQIIKTRPNVSNASGFPYGSWNRTDTPTGDCAINISRCWCSSWNLR